MKFAIIGAGFFGLSIAIKIKEKYPNSLVSIFEKEKDILMGASGKNQFRCHLGYHYPRSEKTIQECKKSFREFNKYFLIVILKVKIIMQFQKIIHLQILKNIKKF